jgi:hypothetical protein
MAATFRDLIKLRKAELESQRTAMRAHLARIDAELVEIEQAERALPPVLGTFVDAPNTLDNIPRANSNALPESPPGTLSWLGQVARDSFAGMTIKQLVRRALRDNHPNGMAATALREYIRNNYGRDVEPNSLRPQLARLKAAGWIQQSGEVWVLAPAGLLYDHPTSMNEKDEPPEESGTSETTDRGRQLLAGTIEPSRFEKLAQEMLNPKPKFTK